MIAAEYGSNIGKSSKVCVWADLCNSYTYPGIELVLPQVPAPLFHVCPRWKSPIPTIVFLVMDFQRSKSEQLANYLREAITRGEIADPLPSFREWTSRLGVGSATLQAAVRVLKNEGLIASSPRKGLYLQRKPKRRSQQHPAVVRWIHYDPKHRYLPPSSELLMEVSQRLSHQHIALTVEWGSEFRTKALHRAGVVPHEMLVFNCLSKDEQQMFSYFRSVLLIGDPCEGIELPFISCDVFSAVRHAVNLLAREGFDRVALVNPAGRKLPETIALLSEKMQAACAQAPRSIRGELLFLPDHVTDQVHAIKIFAKQIHERMGLLVNGKLSSSLLLAVLTDCGLNLPKQVKLLPINCTPSQMMTFPPLSCYPFPINRFAKEVCNAATHYFEGGCLPAIRKFLPLEFIVP